MNVFILQSAKLDLAKCRDWYDQQDPGAGDCVVDGVMADVMELERTAGMHRMILGFHRLLATRFPHAIYYKVQDGEALVFRVLDCRRHPRWIAGQLRNSS